jgi:hypothetical protein
MAKLVVPMLVMLLWSIRLRRPFKQHLYIPLLLHFPLGWPRAQRNDRVTPSRLVCHASPRRQALGLWPCYNETSGSCEPKGTGLAARLPRVIALGINYFGPVDCRVRQDSRRLSIQSSFLRNGSCQSSALSSCVGVIHRRLFVDSKPGRQRFRCLERHTGASLPA